MSITELSYETYDNIESVHDKILSVLKSKNYSLKQDSLKDLTARHPQSMTIWPHEVHFHLSENEFNVKITIKIDHKVGQIYAKKLLEELIPKLAPPNSQTPRITNNLVTRETIIREREIIKIKCPYCGTVYIHSESNCPTCKSPNK